MVDRVLVYEPRDADERGALVDTLRAAGLEVAAPVDVAGLQAALRQRTAVGLVDVSARGWSGGSALQAILRIDPDLELVGLAPAGDIRSAVAALKAGAHTVVERPASEGVVETVLHALARRRLPRQRSAPGHELDRLLGRSPAIGVLRAEIETTARAAHAPVLLYGETGTGKSLAAELVHRTSARRRGPLERLSLVGVTDREIDARLFGRALRPVVDPSGVQGALARAHRGGLLLQHVEQLGSEMQAKLTSFLDSGRFQPAGSRRAVSADVRIYATTRVDLVRYVQAGRFSAELYYRLTQYPLSLPPLRTRPEDIRVLVSAFMDRANRRFGQRVVGVDGAALDKLHAHGWPGNVRELENAVLEAVAGAREEMLSADEFTALGRSPPPSAHFRLPDVGVDLDVVERRLIVEALVRTGGNRSRAARLLGLNRDQMRYRVEKYSLQHRRFDAVDASKG